MIDVVHQINSVQRRVGSRVLDAGEARTVGAPRPPPTCSSPEMGRNQRGMRPDWCRHPRRPRPGRRMSESP